MAQPCSWLGSLINYKLGSNRYTFGKGTLKRYLASGKREKNSLCDTSVHEIPEVSKMMEIT